ncbi:MAG: hypothetical protein GY827_05040 [Cytophagales bacterium]|nr:hypothetical protein [Cytophagales bacterium]
MKKNSIVWLILILLISNTSLVFGQSSQEVFGKNRVQYKQFEWKYLNTEHFKIYYYIGGNRLAYNTARYAEAEYERITNTLGFTPHSPITLIIYNSVLDLQQSNVGLQHKAFVGGQTNFVKSQIEIAFSGSQVEFRQELVKQITSNLFTQIMYGGSFKDVVQNSYLIDLPKWFELGLQEYVAHGWSHEMDSYMRDYTLHRMKAPNHYLGKDARYIGQSIWNFIAKEYGEDNISHIIGLMRILRDPEESITSSLGIPYSAFLYQWQGFYYRRYNQLADTLMFSDKKLRLRKYNRKNYHHHSIAINPDSSLVAYSENFNGRYRVVVYNTEKKKKRIVFYGGQRRVGQKVSANLPIVSWKSAEELGIAYAKKGKAHLLIKNLRTRKKQKTSFESFDAILGMDFSPVRPNEMIISASKKGKNDLYTFDIRSGRAQNITRDLYDDTHPSYLPKTNTVIFSSNRINDTLRADLGKADNITPQYDLWLMNLDEVKKNDDLSILTRLTNTPSLNEKNPRGLDSLNISFLLEQNHSQQIYHYHLPTNKATRISNFYHSIQQFDRNQNHLAYLIESKGRTFVYYEDSMRFKNLESVDIFPILKKKKVKKDTVTFQQALQGLIQLNIDTLFFVGDSIAYPSVANKNKKEELRIYGPRNYVGLFGLDYIVSNLQIDPLRGAGVLMEGSASDMSHNHVFNGNIFLLSDLQSSSLSADYYYLKKRTDLKISYERYNVFALTDLLVQNYTTNSFDVELARPFSVASRISITPNVTHTRYTDYQLVNHIDETNYYGGLKAEYVYDNTLEHDINILEGFRMRAGAKTYFNTENQALNFSKLFVDARKYLRLYRTLTLATRVSYGQSFGNSPKQYLIGGMDNWLFANTNDTGDENPLQLFPANNNEQVLFVEYATGLRGFDYNQMAGNKYFLFNAEVRLPFMKMISNRPVSNNFLRYLQFVAFYDLGSAWSGSNPLTQDNTINTQIEGNSQNGFSATVVNYQNPFLSGYGLGMRTMMMGYYVKFDVAWGVRNYVVQSPKLYLTLGYDF